MKLLIVCVSILLLAVVSLLYGLHATRVAESEFPPVGTFIEIDGLKLHYLDSGDQRAETDQPTIVLLHGASTSLLDFQSNLIPGLSPINRVIAIDRPGHGYSQRGSGWPNPAEQARLVQLALSAIGVEKAIWIGHSWAGSVVLAGMLDYPTQVTAGVLLAGATHPWDTGVSWHVSLANTPLIGQLFARLVVPAVGAKALKGAVAGVFAPEPVPENYVEKTGVELSLRPEIFVNNAADRYYLSDWLETQQVRYTSLTSPLLVITGTADTIVPSWNHAERLQGSVPEAVWIRLTDAGHALHHSRRDTVIRSIKDFLGTL